MTWLNKAYRDIDIDFQSKPKLVKILSWCIKYKKEYVSNIP